MADVTKISDPQEVFNSALKIDGYGDDFFKAYSDLYKIVMDDLPTVFQGEDANAFKAKMESEKIHFESMRTVISDYAEKLRTAAKSHENRENESKSDLGQVNF